ncbi:PECTINESTERASE 63-RELATED [Salix purpurea]|uniref:Pectinesterase n=1 Tax=Salix purpurea TaxID=77065 RepID=A0A9Q0ZVC2_SALPP|nr:PECTINESTERASE 63-RELATED [Salix purpurea]
MSSPTDIVRATLDPALEAAEAKPRTIKVRQDGSGDYRTLTDAVESIPSGNTQRVIVDIAAGVYIEKIKIEKDKPFVTFKGSASNMPTLTFAGTARVYGTVYSATLQVYSAYFVASNIIIKNSAPRPGGRLKEEQAVALRIGGDKAAFYNCRLIGFQDTLCDDMGRHFFKNCYIEGTVDFIFGSGKSLYLATKINVLADQGLAVITAQARHKEDDTGFSFVHCKVNGNRERGVFGTCMDRETSGGVFLHRDEQRRRSLPGGPIISTLNETGRCRLENTGARDQALTLVAVLNSAGS